MRFERRKPTPWTNKFACAGRGLWRAVRTQRSFLVHFCAAVAVAFTAMLLRLSAVENCLLLLCVTAVLAAEVFNTALERMARAITVQLDRRIGDALDMASGAVLLTAFGASLVGLLIFGRRLAILLGWFADS